MFRASRRKWLLVLAGCAAFVFVGALTFTKSPWVGETAIAFFGLGLIVAGWQTVSPGRLVVTPTTIEVTTLGRRWSRDLASCSEFGVWRFGVQTLVVFDHPGGTAKRLGRANRRLSGRSSALPDTFGMDASELASILNKARASAMALSTRTDA